VAQRSVAQANLWSPVSYRGDCVSLRTYLPPTTVACGRHRRPYCVGATALGLAVGYGGGVDRTAHRISLRFIRATGQRSVAVSNRGSRPSWTPCPLCLPGERTAGALKGAVGYGLCPECFALWLAGRPRSGSVEVGSGCEPLPGPRRLRRGLAGQLPAGGQRRSVARSDAHCAAAEQLRRAAEPELAAVDALPGAVLRQAFSGAV
jgi:hypothetical protein